jgi:hypothetical protein
MDKKLVIILSVAAAAVVILLLHNYVFSIYETDFRLSNDVLYADNMSTVKIIAVPINGLGMRAPFRKVPTVFTFEEGAELVDVVSKDENNGVMVIKARLSSGKVIIRAKAKYSLLPSVFEIPILANTASL